MLAVNQSPTKTVRLEMPQNDVLGKHQFGFLRYSSLVRVMITRNPDNELKVRQTPRRRKISSGLFTVF